MRISEYQTAIFASVHLPPDQHTMQYFAAVAGVTDIISEPMEVPYNERKATTGKHAIRMITEGDWNGKFKHDHDLGLSGKVSDKDNNAKGDAATHMIDRTQVVCCEHIWPQ